MAQSSALIDQPEHELLLACLPPVPTAENINQIRTLVTDPIDWSYLFLFARRHSVLPLLYLRLQENATGLIDAEQLRPFREYYQENLARNVLLTSELLRLISMLGENGIDAIPYKGPALTVFAYDSPALRRFVDLDVMVRKEDVSRAIDILLDQGFELSRPLSVSQRRVLLKTQHNVQFRRHHGMLIVELHWEVATHLFASSVRAEDLWQNLSSIELNGTPVKTLSAEDLVFSLCVHGSRHLWERLLWICDISWLMVKRDLNWDVLLQRAKSANAERMFLLGPYLCKRLLNMPLPSVVNHLIAGDPRLDPLSDGIMQRLFNGVEHFPALTFDIFRYNFQVRNSWSSRARYFRHMICPTDRDLEVIRLPGPLSFGYYLVRPFRLLFKTGQDAS